MRKGLNVVVATVAVGLFAGPAAALDDRLPRDNTCRCKCTHGNRSESVDYKQRGPCELYNRKACAIKDAYGYWRTGTLRECSFIPGILDQQYRQSGDDKPPKRKAPPSGTITSPATAP